MEESGAGGWAAAASPNPLYLTRLSYGRHLSCLYQDLTAAAPIIMKLLKLLSREVCVCGVGLGKVSLGRGLL